VTPNATEPVNGKHANRVVDATMKKKLFKKIIFGSFWVTHNLSSTGISEIDTNEAMTPVKSAMYDGMR
jgi:hypothetical protein